MSGAVAMEIPQTQTDYAEPAVAEQTYAERVAQREAEWRDAHHEHSTAPEPEVEAAETEYVEETTEAGYVEETAETEYADQEDEVEDVEEPAPPKRGLAARFAARRAKRNAAKTGGGSSLSDRLRRITSESPETHT